jgi:hypothetical protein
VAVEVVAGPVIPSGGARVGVTRRDLDITKWDAGVEGGSDEGVAK